MAYSSSLLEPIPKRRFIRSISSADASDGAGAASLSLALALSGDAPRGVDEPLFAPPARGFEDDGLAGVADDGPSRSTVDDALAWTLALRAAFRLA